MSRTAIGSVTITDLADGKGSFQGYLYYVKTSAQTTAPTAPTNAQVSYNNTTGLLENSGGNTLIGGVGTKDKWLNEAPLAEATSSDIIWTVKYSVLEDPPGTYTVSFGSVVQHISFTGVVTFNGTSFTDGSNTYNTTTIDGSNITTGTIDAARIDVANISVGDLTNDAGFITGVSWTDVTSKPSDASFSSLALSTMPNGGISDILFTKNTDHGGVVNSGEIRVQGSAFYHPNGTKTTLQSDSRILTNYGEGDSANPFFIIFSLENPYTRFSWGTFAGVSSNFFPAEYDYEEGLWYAHNNNGTLTTAFTPLESDCIVAYGAADSAGGIDYVYSIMSVNRNPAVDGATQNPQWFKLPPKTNTDAPTDSEFATIFGRDPVKGDIVLVTNSTSGDTKTYQYTGTTWNEAAAVIRGDMLVKGTVRADRIDVIGSEATIKIDGNETTPLVIENVSAGEYFKVKPNGRIEASAGIFQDGGIALSKLNQAQLNEYLDGRLGEVGTFTPGVNETVTDTINLAQPTDTVCIYTTPLSTDLAHNIEFRLEDSWAHSLVDITETAANGGPVGDITINYEIEGSTNGTTWVDVDTGSTIADSVVIEGTAQNGGTTTETQSYNVGTYSWVLEVNSVFEPQFTEHFLTLTVVWNGTTVYFDTDSVTNADASNSPLYSQTSVSVGNNTYNRGTFSTTSTSGGSGESTEIDYYGVQQVGQSTIVNGLETFTLSLIRNFNPGTSYPYYRAKLTGFTNTDTFNGTTPTDGGSGAIAFDGEPSLRVYTAGSSSIFSAGNISVTTATTPSGGGSLSYDNSGELTFTPADLSSFVTQTDIDNSVSTLVASAPDALNTLNELAAALGDDANFSTTVSTSIGTKANKAGDTFTGGIVSSKNIATTSANGEFDVSKTILGNIHFANGDGASGSPKEAGITWQGSSSTQAQAGIYVVNDNSSGTHMAIATTNNYSTGPQIAVSITNYGIVDFPRGRPTYGGNGLWSSGDFSASQITNWDTAYGWGNHASAGYLTSFDITTQTDPKYLRSNADDSYSGNITATGTDWYLWSLGDRGASVGEYGIGNRSDDDYRQLTFHVPNHAAYSNLGEVPSFGWYSNGSVELMNLLSGTGVLSTKGGYKVGSTTVIDSSRNASFANLDYSGSIVNGSIKQEWTTNYVLNNTTPKELLYSNGQSLPSGGVYRFSAHISGTGTDNWATAVYWNQNGTWKLNVTQQSGVSSNHPEFVIDSNIPTLIIDHSSNYTVHVFAERLEINEGSGTDNNAGFGADSFLGNVGGALRYNPYGSGVDYSTGDKVFHDSYHPNADKWTTARTITLSGDLSGSVSLDGSANVTLSAQVTNNSHDHTRLSGFANQTEYDLIRAGNTNGLCFKARWDGTTGNRYWDMGYVDGFGTFYSGLKVYNNGALTYKGNTVFHDDYHPNADKWTTAKTLSLTGDVTGSVSWDGSADASITTTVANDSHTHDGRYYTETESDSRFVRADNGVTTNNSNLGLVVSSNMSIDHTGNVISKITNDNSWNGHVYSSTGFTGGCLFRYSPTNTDRRTMVGINSDPTTNSSYTSIDYCFYIQVGGSLIIYESGTSIDTGRSYVVGDDLAIIYDNSNIRYYHNNELIRRVSTTSGRTFHFDSSFYDVYSNYTNYLVFEPYIEKNDLSTLSILGNEVIDSNRNLTNIASISSGTINAGAISSTISGNNYNQVNSTDTGEAMHRYNNSVSNYWYVGIRSSSQLVGNTGYHIYSTASGQTVFGLTAGGEMRAKFNVVAYYSDDRLKTKVGKLDNALSKVCSLNGFIYVENEKAKELGYDSNKEQVGLSAQEVQNVLPQAVRLAPVDCEIDEDGNDKSISGEDYLTLDYAKVVPLLVEAIKEQKSIVDEQQKQIENLTNLVNNLLEK
jgi:hypothetical protein